MTSDPSFRHAAMLMAAMCLIFCGVQAVSEAAVEKTRGEVDSHINQVGSTSPDWWDSVELTYPETLEMDWPVQQGFFRGFREFEERGGRGGPGGRFRGGGRGGRGGFGGPGERMGPGRPGGREGFGGAGEWMGPGGGGGRGFRPGQSQQRSINVDQYLMQVVYPNPSRHREGIKLVNHLMIMHKDDKEKLKRSLNTLGQMFFDLFDDYVRAAFWWKKCEEMGGSVDSLKMARCYSELGSRTTAAELLSQAEGGYFRNSKEVIKLWAKIGEVDKALAMIESSAGSNSGGMSRMGFGRGMGSSRSEDYLLAAEICRGAGRYDEAIAYYEKVLALPDSYTRAMSHHETDGKLKANSNLEGAKLLRRLDLKRVRDGSYSATTTAYGGPLTLQVVVKRGRIESVEIMRHRETFSYLIMAEPTARQIVTRQGFEGVDVITGATVTSDAIINAAAKALFNAME